MAKIVNQVQEEVKNRLKQTNQQYKEYADKRRRKVHFQIGDKVWAYLKKERLPKGRYSKLHMNKVGACIVLHKMGENSYEITLPPTLSVSPIFNVFDLTLYKGDVGCDVIGTSTSSDNADILDFFRNLPPRKPVQLEKILESKLLRKTKTKTYMHYLVKWKG